MTESLTNCFPKCRKGLPLSYRKIPSIPFWPLKVIKYQFMFILIVPTGHMRETPWNMLMWRNVLRRRCNTIWAPTNISQGWCSIPQNFPHSLSVVVTKKVKASKLIKSFLAKDNAVSYIPDRPHNGTKC